MFAFMSAWIYNIYCILYNVAMHDILDTQNR